MPGTPSTLDATRRPLGDAERRAIRAKVRSLVARRRRTSRATLPVTGGAVVLLWLWTLLASDTSWPIVTVFWLVVGGGMAAWVGREMRAEGDAFKAMAADLESALKTNTADVYDIRARSVVEFEEIEDEGACYAFELADGRVVFVAGQEFYESARFPSLDFSLVYVLGERQSAVDMFIEKRGGKVAPARKIPAAMKSTLRVPNHLEVRAGTLEDLDSMVR
jgi:hypothetical protein